MPKPSMMIPRLAIAAIALLAAMVAITLATGVSQETFEIGRAPAVYAADLVAHAAPLRVLFGLDTAFLVVYATLLLVVARRLSAGPGDRAVLLAIAIGAIVLTALLDMVEDHHILAMLRGAEGGDVPSAAQIALQHTLSQTKFNISYFGLFLVGLHVPRTSRTGWTLAVLLTAGTLAQGAWLYAAPDALLPIGNIGRWVGYVVGFALFIPVMRGVAAAPERAAGAGATGAPA